MTMNVTRSFLDCLGGKKSVYLFFPFLLSNIEAEIKNINSIVSSLNQRNEQWRILNCGSVEYSTPSSCIAQYWLCSAYVIKGEFKALATKEKLQGTTLFVFCEIRCSCIWSMKSKDRLVAGEPKLLQKSPHIIFRGWNTLVICKYRF